jgi:hypothetical protein
MSKFEDVIATKLEQLDEIDASMTSQGQQAQAGTQQPAQQPTQPQQPQQPQQQQQPQQPEQQEQQPPEQQQTNPEESLAQAFQSINFGDSAKATQALNNALKTAGNVPGMNEFFSALAFDPEKGFMAAQAQPTSTQ